MASSVLSSSPTFVGAEAASLQRLESALFGSVRHHPLGAGAGFEQRVGTSPVDKVGSPRSAEEDLSGGTRGAGDFRRGGAIQGAVLVESPPLLIIAANLATGAARSRSNTRQHRSRGRRKMRRGVSTME